MIPRLMIFIVSYNAEAHIQSVLRRIPYQTLSAYASHSEIVIFDDASHDRTTEAAEAIRAEIPVPLTIRKNPKNLGYGGNQKSGYQYAIDQGFDAVILLHGDGQYAPEQIPNLLKKYEDDNADCVLGSRMMDRRGALKGGMPLYKFLGNIFLTGVQNYMLHVKLSEFHTGYRVYRCAALKRIPFQKNDDWFHFDTQIIIQLIQDRAKVVEIGIPTFYGNEICHVHSIRYGLLVLWETFKAVLHYVPPKDR